LALSRWVEPIVQLKMPGVLIRLPSTETTVAPVGFESTVTRTQVFGSEIQAVELVVVDCELFVDCVVVEFEVEE
jgi:hypothetical protein